MYVDKILVCFNVCLDCSWIAPYSPIVMVTRGFTFQLQFVNDEGNIICMFSFLIVVGGTYYAHVVRF
jgi:hypothetical protein